MSKLLFSMFSPSHEGQSTLMREPKITVIIPTRERCETLAKSLLTVTSQSYDNLQIIVSDNFSGDRTEDVVRSVNDKRLRYLNTGERIGMSQNWEFALSHVDTGWVTIIGDDDGLLPESVSKLAKLVKANSASAVRSSVCSYVWPSLIDKKFGRIGVPLRSGYEVRDSREWLQKVLSGRAGYPQLPMLYSGGYVNMSVLNEIKRRTGRIYNSCVPDVYSAISIASVVETYIYSWEPLAINGASRHSTGTAYFARGKDKAGSPAQIFATEGNIPFHEDIPLCRDGSYPPSMQAIIYESYLQSNSLRLQSVEDLPAKMLTIILATAGRHQSLVQDWAKIFAKRHHLNFHSIEAKAKVAKIAIGINSGSQQLATLINMFSVGSCEFPISDVYEASIVAAAVRTIGVGRSKNILRLFRRLLERAGQEARHKDA
jgi:glycosyltransferase involved in cell wall biosynthesis